MHISNMAKFSKHFWFELDCELCRMVGYTVKFKEIGSEGLRKVLFWKSHIMRISFSRMVISQLPPPPIWSLPFAVSMVGSIPTCTPAVKAPQPSILESFPPLQLNSLPLSWQFSHLLFNTYFSPSLKLEMPTWNLFLVPFREDTKGDWQGLML